MSEEIWKPVVGYENYYSVSSLGRVRRDRKGQGTRPNALLIGWLTATGYRQVMLHTDGRAGRVARYIHRLVAAAFLGPCPQHQEVNHQNGNKGDNRVGNLEYVTRADNMYHAFDHDLARRGSRHPWAKLTEADVVQIRHALADGQRNAAIARQFGVTAGAIAQIRNGRNWRRVA